MLIFKIYSYIAITIYLFYPPSPPLSPTQSRQDFFALCRHISKADIRNPLSLLAHERSRFANCQWELLTPTDISIPLTHRLVLYTLEAGDCLFCVKKGIPCNKAVSRLHGMPLYESIFIFAAFYHTYQVPTL